MLLVQYALGANREYQGRGLQHSHAEGWVRGALIIGESTEEKYVSLYPSMSPVRSLTVHSTQHYMKE